MIDLDERARRLVDAARSGHNPSAADAARVRAALTARVLAEPLLIESPAGAIQPGQVAASGVLGKVSTALMLGSALGFAAGLYAAPAFWRDERARPIDTGAKATAVAGAVNEPSSTAMPAPLPRRTEGNTDDEAGSASARRDRAEAGADAPDRHATAMRATPPPAPAPTRAAPRASSGRASSAITAPGSAAPGVSPLKAELDGLRRAQELLYQGRPAWAIARLDELDRSEVGSVLLEERAATRAIAECRLGADGQRQADEYARRFPRSAHLERVRSSCAGALQEGTRPTRGETPATKVAPRQTESQGSPHEE